MINKIVVVDITTGSLAGTQLKGRLSYDDANLSGVGWEFLYGTEGGFQLEFDWFGRTLTETSNPGFVSRVDILDGTLLGLQYFLGWEEEQPHLYFQLGKFSYEDTPGVTDGDGRVNYLNDDSPGEPSGWTMPVESVSGLCPMESPDRRQLYVALPSTGSMDIWVYRRQAINGNLGPRIRLGDPISLDDSSDSCPSPLPGNWLMFVSDRAEIREEEQGCGNTDLYLSRFRPRPPAASESALVLRCAPLGPNTSGSELSPSVVKTPQGTYLYYSSDVGGDQDIYVSTKDPEGRFSEGVPVEGLNTEFEDREPSVSADGLLMVFASNRDDAAYGGALDIFISTRADLNSPWSEPRNLSWELDFPTHNQDETGPSLSTDAQRLYFSANGHVYQSERTAEE